MYQEAVECVFLDPQLVSMLYKPALKQRPKTQGSIYQEAVGCVFLDPQLVSMPYKPALEQTIQDPRIDVSRSRGMRISRSPIGFHAL